MTKLEAWLEEKKQHFEDFGSLSEYDAKKAIAIIEKLKAALESISLPITGSTALDNHEQVLETMYNDEVIAKEALAIEPEKLK